MKNKIIITTLTLFAVACNSSVNSGTIALDKQAVLNMEKEFADDVKKEGIAAGFAKYAADDAVVSRNGNLIKGIANINEFYQRNRSGQNKLEWTAEFADVAVSGDMAYTYGKYIYTAYDSTGKPTEYKGVFHTVWKKQKDGKWKFVYD